MSKTILIIEDEDYIAQMYKIKFEKSGYKVILAPDGEKGLAAARQEKIDLILLDLLLPKIDGFAVLKKLKSNKETKDIKVYILSILGQIDEISRGFKMGAQGYFIKSSLTPAQLLEQVENIFNGKEVGVRRLQPVVKEIMINKNNVSYAKAADVLLIEDEEVIIDMYKLALEKAGFKVIVARNGAWGLKAAREHEFDIILMDIVMPAMRGNEAIKKIRESNKSVPIIVLSNSAQERDITEAKKMGADSYLIKALITPTKLVQEIKRMLKLA